MCRAWRPLATSHLFRKIRYTFSYLLATDCESCCRESAYELARRCKTLDELHTFLVVNPVIRGYIRKLILRGYAPLVSDGESTQRDAMRVTPDLLTSVINILHNLRHLELVNVSCSNNLEMTSPPPVVNLSLESVDIQYRDYVGVRCEDPVEYTELDCARLLGLFGTVRVLRLFPPLQKADEPLPKSNYEENLRISTLEIGRTSDKLFGYLTRCPEVCGSIKRFVMRYPLESMVEPLLPFLQAVGPTLQELMFFVAIVYSDLRKLRKCLLVPGVMLALTCIF